MSSQKLPQKRLLSIDELDRGIVSLTTRINTATYELLVLVRQFASSTSVSAGGELSYSKVRPLTRVARADNEESLLAFALKTTASRVEER